MDKHTIRGRKISVTIADKKNKKQGIVCIMHYDIHITILILTIYLYVWIYITLYMYMLSADRSNAVNNMDMGGSLLLDDDVIVHTKKPTKEDGNDSIVVKERKDKQAKKALTLILFNIPTSTTLKELQAVYVL